MRGQLFGQKEEPSQPGQGSRHINHRSLGGGGGGAGGAGGGGRGGVVLTDDGGATSFSTDDGVVSTKAQGSVSEYGALLEALADELVSTLSINPFDVDLAQATPILALCGALAGTILFGALFFMKWDAGDHPRPSSLVCTSSILPPVTLNRQRSPRPFTFACF